MLESIALKFKIYRLYLYIQNILLYDLIARDQTILASFIDICYGGQFL